MQRTRRLSGRSSAMGTFIFLRIGLVCLLLLLFKVNNTHAQQVTADYIDSQIGNVIEYYVRWEFEEDPFYGKARIKGLVDDDSGGLKIICDIIEGSDLEQAYEEEEIFMLSDNHPIYTGTLPEIYSANWVSTDGKKKKQIFIAPENENAKDFAIAQTNSKVIVKRIY